MERPWKGRKGLNSAQLCKNINNKINNYKIIMNMYVDCAM